LNAQENAHKLDTKFLIWISKIILASDANPKDSKAQGRSQQMLDYLFFWYARFKNIDPNDQTEKTSFSSQIIEQCRKNPDLSSPGGIFSELVHEPDPENKIYFHTIRINEYAYTFAQSLDIWYLKTYAPDIRILYDLTKNYHCSARLSKITNDEIRKTNDPSRKKDFQAALTTYIIKLNEESENANKALQNTIEAIEKKEENTKGMPLTEKIIRELEKPVIFFSPLSDRKEESRLGGEIAPSDKQKK